MPNSIVSLSFPSYDSGIIIQDGHSSSLHNNRSKNYTGDIQERQRMKGKSKFKINLPRWTGKHHLIYNIWRRIIYRLYNSPGYSSSGVKLTTHLHLVPRSRMVELYMHSPIRLHGAVLNQWSTGTTLPFSYSTFSCIKVYHINLIQKKRDTVETVPQPTT
jgi:hypothetical protein